MSFIKPIRLDTILEQNSYIIKFISDNIKKTNAFIAWKGSIEFTVIGLKDNNAKFILLQDTPV